MQTKLIFMTLIALITTVSWALPNGAPACVINVNNIQSGMGAPQGDRQFKIIVDSNTYMPGQTLKFKIASDNPATKTFKGVLIYIMPKTNSMMRVGTFTIPQGLKSNVDKCAPKGFQATVNSVVTHSSPDDKPIDLEMPWLAPNSYMGELIVSAVIAGTGPQNWQVATPLSLLPSSNTTDYQQRRTKCRPARYVTGIPQAASNYGTGSYITSTVPSTATETAVIEQPTDNTTGEASGDGSYTTGNDTEPISTGNDTVPITEAAQSVIEDRSSASHLRDVMSGAMLAVLMVLML